MNIGGGEAADQMTRMMLSGGEIAIRLTGSALKNSIAVLAALAQNHRKLYGRTSLVKLLRDTRDIRVFPMTKEQFQRFRAEAKQLKLLYAGVQDRRNPSAPIDLMIPASDLERANQIFERIQFASKEPLTSEEPLPKKESRSERSSGATERSSSTPSRDGNKRPSLLQRLEGYRREQGWNPDLVPTKSRANSHKKVR